MVLSCCKSIFLSYCLGTQGPRNGTPARYSKSLWRPLGTPRPDFLDFFTHREGFKKPWFFGIAPKRHKSKDKSSMGRHCRHFRPKNIRRTRRVLGVLNYMGITREQRSNQPTPSLNPSPAGPEITIRADPVRLIT